MYKKNKISIMLIVILLLQILLPTISVIFENGITLESIAAEEISSGDWTYVVNDDETTITITEYKGTDAYLTIPSQIDGYTVTGLGDGTHTDATRHSYSVFYFGYCINEIQLPSTMKKIADIAFMGCENLTNVELNEGLEIIGNQAFLRCEKLKKVEIPSTVKTLTNDAYLNTFYGCISLESITVNQNNQYYSSSEGVLFNKEKTIMIAYPSAKKETSYSIPKSVNQIYGKAINSINLESLYITENINNMKGNQEYSWSRDVWAIEGCTNLNSVTVDEANEVFSSENGILYDVGKSTLILYPTGKTDANYNIPSTVRSCEVAISNPYIETIKINASIDDVTFLTGMQNLKNIEVDSTNSNYIQKDGVLFDKSGKKIVYYPIGRTNERYEIDSNVTEISSKAFANSKITQIDLPSNLVEIGDSAFYNCSNLENITIPKNVTQIGSYAFYNCSNLESITIPKSVTKIGSYAFYNCESMNELIFEENSKIEQIGNEAFSNCSNIEEVNIPEGPTSIDGFSGEIELRIINIPSTVSNIPAYSFNSIYTRSQIITINNENPTIFQRLGIF